MATSPDQQLATMLANLPEKTGKPLSDWLGLIAAQKLAKHGEIVKFLKTDHGVTHGFANLIAHQALNGADAAPDDLVGAQYAGAKADLRPIHDALVAYVRTLGSDVEIAPKKTCVSLRRSKQFALIQPSTRTRVDLGINLKGTEPTGKLESSGSFNAMVSHRVRLAEAGDIDKDVKAWLKQAYEQA